MDLLKQKTLSFHKKKSVIESNTENIFVNSIRLKWQSKSFYLIRMTAKDDCYVKYLAMGKKLVLMLAKNRKGQALWFC